jgi:hypothetical protein
MFALTSALFAFALYFSAPVFATQPCREEFGEKSSLVNIVGWGIIAFGFVIGVILMRYVVIGSQGLKWPLRSLFISMGICGMLITWFAGLLVAVGGFFLAC